MIDKTRLVRMTKNTWIQCWNPRPFARLRLFCLHYAGGGASVYRTWSTFMPADIEVCAIQLPGRENRLNEAPLARMTSIIEVLTDHIIPYLDRPFAVFGHSMGALVGFELTRALRCRREPLPVHLFASGRQAPRRPNNSDPYHDLPDSEFIEAIRRLQGTPEEVLRNAELMDVLLPILRADFAVVETYEYHAETLLDCPIRVYGSHDDRMTFDDLAAWRDETNGTCTLHMFEGGHFFLHRDREALLRDITAHLNPYLLF